MNKTKDAIAFLSTVLIFLILAWCFFHYLGKNALLFMGAACILGFAEHYRKIWKKTTNKNFSKSFIAIFFTLFVLYCVLALFFWYFSGIPGLSAIFTISILLLWVGIIPYKKWVAKKYFKV